MICHKIGIPPTSNIALGLSRVKSRMRLLPPPQRIITGASDELTLLVTVILPNKFPKNSANVIDDIGVEGGITADPKSLIHHDITITQFLRNPIISFQIG